MRAACLCILATTAAWGYIQNTGDGGQLHRTTDATNIQMLLNSNAVAGLTNADNPAKTWIASGSNVTLAVNAALSTWNSAPSANIHFAPVTATALLDGTACTAGQACSNVIAFDDTSANRQLVGGAIAVTINTFLDDASGTILKSDIIFNPEFEFSTTLAAGTYDLQSIITHELGHALGSSHSGIISATMFWDTAMQQTDYSRPQPDDLAFLAAVYPKGGAYGTVAGTVQDSNGHFLRGALISLQDANSGTIIGGFSSLKDGSYSFLAPPGNYSIWAQPLGGQILPENLYLLANQVDLGFQTTAPTPGITVAAGASTSATIAASMGSSSLVVTQTGAALPSANSVEIGPGAANVASGTTLSFFIDVAGTNPSDFAQMASISFIPAGIVVNSAVSAVQALSDGELYQFSITVPAVTKRTAATLFITYKGNTASYTGGMVLLPAAPVPSFLNGVPAVVNVFGFPTGVVGVVAPGELVSIYGTNMGPNPAAAGALDLAGSQVTYVGGIQVTFDGQPAPIFYAGTGQINVEVPYEVAGKASTNIQVITGAASTPATLAVQNTVPGLFIDAVNYPSNKLNTAGNPTAAGLFIILYATGLGPLKTPVGTGAVVTGSDSAANPVTVSFGGQSVKPAYAGASPGFTGLQQINVKVPSGLGSGPVPLTVTSNGQVSNAITVYVQ